MMDKALTKNNKKTANGLQKSNSSKNRLRIHGMAILERDDHPNITASYDYTTLCASDFFEEDVNELQYFELNKIAMGMTIYKKDESFPKIKNGYSVDHEDTKPTNSLALHYDNHCNSRPDPILTDVIWSRMDITNPNANRNAYIIKQQYNSKNQETLPSHSERCNNFVCGFVSCCIMMCFGCALAFLYNYSFHAD